MSCKYVKSNSRIVYMFYDDQLYMLKSNKIYVMLCYIHELCDYLRPKKGPVLMCGFSQI